MHYAEVSFYTADKTISTNAPLTLWDLKKNIHMAVQELLGYLKVHVSGS